VGHRSNEPSKPLCFNKRFDYCNGKFYIHEKTLMNDEKDIRALNQQNPWALEAEV
jgi:hypothetical protein